VRQVDTTETDDLVERFAAAPGRIAQAAGGHDATRLHTAPADGEWSPRDILAHLRASDDILGSRLIQILVRDQAPLPAFDERRWAEVVGYGSREFESLLATFTARRAELAAMLDGLSPDDWQRAGLHEERGPRTILQLLRILVEHEAEHVAQIEASLA
jgi:hypothetical protein